MEDSLGRYIVALSLIVLLFFSAFFSAAETAYSSVKKSKIEKDALKNDKAALLIKKHYKKFGWTLSTIVVSNNIVNIASSSLTTYLFASMITNQFVATIIATFAITPAIVIFGEIIPKIIAKKYSYGYLRLVVRVINLFNIILYPITYPMSNFTLSSSITNTEEEIESIVDIASEEGILEKKEATLVKNALNLDSLAISQVLTPLSEFIQVDSHAKIKAAMVEFKNSGHTRLPVWDEKTNSFIGALHLKDVIAQHSEAEILEFVIKIPKITKNTLSTMALEKMRSKKTHMALVIDNVNTGTVIGLVTMEDIIEELIGEVYDEHDETEEINQVELHKYEILGDTYMHDVWELIDAEFTTSSNISLTKWMELKLSKTLEIGDVFEYQSKFIFKVLEINVEEENMIELKVK